MAALAAPPPVYAQTQNLNLAWDANPESDIASYYVHVGTSSGNYNLAVTPVPGNQLTFAFPATPGVRYYFAVRAVNTAGAWSPSSSEVVGGVPSFTQPANQVGIVGTLIAPLQLSAVDPDGGSLQFSSSNLPPGLTMSTAGRVTGTPTTTGTYTVTVAVFDGTVTVQRSFTWTIKPAPATVTATSVVPSTGSAWSQTFALTYGDSLGATDLTTAAVLFNPTLASFPANSCMVSFDQPAKLVYLLNDTGKSWTSGAIGTATTLENSQCAVALATSSVAASGTSLELNLAMSFKPAFSGSKNVYLYATSSGGQNSGWIDRGNFTVPTVSASITSNVSSPQVAGTALTLTGAVTNGRGSYEYRWLLFDGTAWSVLREWGAATTAWTPTQPYSGYKIGLWARLVGSTVGDATASLPFSITAPTSTAAQPAPAKLTITSLSSSLPSPQLAGTAITFTATSTGGTSPEFKWLLYNGSTWSVLREWGTASYTWTPSQANANYQIGVWGRSAGSVAGEAAASTSFVITAPVTTQPAPAPAPAKLAITSVTSNVPSPQVAGTAITLTAQYTGGTTPEFKWLLYNGSTWSVLREWGAASFTWTPTLANKNYQIGVWGRSAGSVSGEAAASLPFVITAPTTELPAKLTITSITSDVPSPQPAGTSITFTANTTGGTAPEFKWLLYNGSTWSVLREWGAASVTWTPAKANNYYQIGVWARSAGTIASEAVASKPFVITVPPPALTPSSTSVTMGSTVTVTLTGGSGSGTDWISIAPVGSPDNSYLQYTFVGSGVTTRTWSVVLQNPGTYEFRLFRDGYTRVATSAPVTVADATPAVLTVSATQAASGTPVTVTLTNGRGGASDWLALAATGAANTSYIQWVYVGSGVTTRDWTVNMPSTPGTYEFRLFLSNGTRAATSPTITVP